MLAVQTLTIDAFLPLARMKELAPSAHSSYTKAVPFLHIVIHDFFDPELLQPVLAEFPKPGAIRWQSFDYESEIKVASAAQSSFGPVTRLLLCHLDSITFLEILSAVTGIANLIPDPSFDGGDLHQIVRGGKLGLHADFNRHGSYNLDRQMNLLVYLNQGWREENGGHLEVWNRDMTRCEARVLPVFNRVIIFGTTDFAYHGHPDPLQCAEDMTRRSLAFYYFTSGRRAEEISAEHSTLFRAHHDGECGSSAGRRLRSQIRGSIAPDSHASTERAFVTHTRCAEPALAACKCNGA
jgi:Rps23 Pro-64 3,4-dihydroxylase Tpa1-like proline 4-hydroxylase